MKKRDSTILIGFILLKFVLQALLIDSGYDLQRDEFLHLDQANHLAWGFESVPPFTSWISIIIKLFGNTVFFVKFFPALFGALTIVVVWKTIELLKGNLYAKILGATCVLFSVLLRLNTLFQPNSFDVLSWTIVFFFIIKYTITEKPKWLYWGAVFLGVGFLNKYNIVFLMLGILPALLLGKKRSVFLKKELYYSMGISFIIVLPNLIWQYSNSFPVFNHLNELAETQLIHVNRIRFLKNQLLFFTGSIIIILSALYSLIYYKPFREIKFLFLSFVFVLIIFSLLRAKDYYAIGLYPIYISIGSAFLSKKLVLSWGKILKLTLVSLPLFAFAFMYGVVFPNKTPEYIIAHKEKYTNLGLLHWEDGKNHDIPQDFADMLGWKELANKVDKVYAKIENPENTLILCDNYGQAGAINYYSKYPIQAISLDADYINWFNSDITYTNLIRIKNRHERNNELRETSSFFKSSYISDSICNKYAREFGTVIFVFLESNVNINERIENEIREIKNHRKQSD